MARIKMVGLSYFPFDTNFFDSRKIKGLRSKFGNDGVSLYVYLLCEIYRDKGYYLEIDSDFFAIVADDNGLTEDKVKEIISYFCTNDYFDLTLYDKKILSSTEVQKQYQECTKARGKYRQILVNKDFWLLKNDENEDYLSFGDENCFGKNPTKKSKEKKSKVNESKEKECVRAHNVSIDDEQYESLVATYGQKQTDDMIKHLSAFKSATGKTYESDYDAIIYWVVDWYEKRRKKGRGKTGNSTFDVEDFARWEFENTYK